MFYYQVHAYGLPLINIALNLKASSTEARTVWYVTLKFNLKQPFPLQGVLLKYVLSRISTDYMLIFSGDFYWSFSCVFYEPLLAITDLCCLVSHRVHRSVVAHKGPSTLASSDLQSSQDDLF